MRVVLTVSGTIPTDVDEKVAAGARPRPDYRCIADELGADLLDHAGAARATGVAGRLVRRVLGANVTLTWAVFRARARYDVIITDGEQIGIPLAFLLRLFGRRGASHVMIAHRVSAFKKVLPWRLFRLGRGIDVAMPYASAQRRVLIERLGMPAGRVRRIDFMVDSQFFDPAVEEPEGVAVICAAGLERRDYATLCEAVRGLPVPVVIAAASPWSKQRNPMSGELLPPEVSVCTLDHAGLRALYARSRFVVVPLVETDFQAGVTTILEAFSMARAVVCSATTGQTDVVDATTGVYVPPGDVAALRRAIDALLADPARAESMGAAARAAAVSRFDVRVYAHTIGDICRGLRS